MKYSIFASVKRLCQTFFLLVFMMAALPASAGGHGGGGASGPEPLQFTVNVGGKGGMGQMLQVMMMFEFAHPEAAAHLAEIKPKVQHRILLLLSNEDATTLQTSKGKIDLQERIVEELNGLLHETTKTGVSEVLFTSFIIQ